MRDVCVPGVAMRPTSLIPANVLGFVLGLVEVDLDAKPETRQRHAEMRAEVSHHASMRFHVVTATISAHALITYMSASRTAGAKPMNDCRTTAPLEVTLVPLR